MGIVANIPIVRFFTSVAYLLLAAKVRKTGTFLIMGIINVLPGLMAANVFGVIDNIAGWALAEVVATRIGYSNRKGLVAAYVVGCTLQSALYTLPIYLSAAQHLSECQEILRLTDEDHVAVRRDALGSHVRRNSCPYGGDEPCRCVRLAKDHEEAF